MSNETGENVLVQNLIPDDEQDKPVSLSQKRSLVDQIVLIEKSVINPEQLQLRIDALLAEKEKARVVEALFCQSWREYVVAQLKSGREFLSIYKSVVELDRTASPDPRNPEKPLDPRYDILYKAMCHHAGNSVGAVETIIKRVVLEFRPSKVKQPV